MTARVERHTERPRIRLLKVAALGVYALLYAELFLRVFSPQAIMPRYVTGTSWGVRGNIPNAMYWHHTPEVTVQYRINSQGMRADHDYPIAKPPSTCRVALYGDSFFVGYELPLKQTFATRLEQSLQAAGIHAEVLNFAVSGFGTGEMLRAHEGFGRQFDPDLVIFEWHDTDPSDNMRSGLYRLENGTIRPTHRTYLPGIRVQDLLMRSWLYRLVADNSQLYTFVRERAAILVKQILLAREQARAHALQADPPAASPEPDTPEAENPYDHPRIQLSAALLSYARDVMHRERRAFYVVSIPERRSRTEFRSYAEVLPPATRAGLAIIDPTDTFRHLAAPDRKLYYEKGAGHLTPMAVDALTRQTVAAIEKDAAFSACRTTPYGASERWSSNVEHASAR